MKKPKHNYIQKGKGLKIQEKICSRCGITRMITGPKDGTYYILTNGDRVHISPDCIDLSEFYK